MARDKTAQIRLLGPRDLAPGPRPRLRVPRRRGPPDHRSGGPGADPRAGHPARLEGRVDLPGPARAPAGDGHRRRRPQAVPLPRRLAHPARLREVRRHGALRARAAGPARPRGGPPRRGGDDARARAGVRRPPARPRVLPHRLRAVRGREPVLRAGHDVQGARDHLGRRDGLRLPGQERRPPRAGGRGPAGVGDRRQRSSAAAAAGTSCSPSRRAGAGATCARTTSTST